MRNDRTIWGRILLSPNLLSVGATLLLSGCGWFDGGTPPANLLGARPGADRLAPVTNALPPPDSGRPHEGGVAPADETRGAQTGAAGAILSGKGGQKAQKAQKEEAEKQASELSRKAREERAAREAASGKATPPAAESPEPSKD